MLAMAMARQEPSHIEGLQALKRTDLNVEIPPAVALGTHQHALVAVPPHVIAAEQNPSLITEQQAERARGVPRRWQQFDLWCEFQWLLPFQYLLSRGCGIGITAMNPALTGEGLSPALMVSHVIPMREHDLSQAAHRLDPPGQWCAPPGNVNHDVAIGALNQPAAGTETALGRPAAIEHLTGGVAADPAREAVSRCGALQRAAGLDRGNRASLQGLKGLALGCFYDGLLKHDRRFCTGSEVIRIKGPAGAAIDAALIDAELV